MRKIDILLKQVMRQAALLSCDTSTTYEMADGKIECRAFPTDGGRTVTGAVVWVDGVIKVDATEKREEFLKLEDLTEEERRLAWGITPFVARITNSSDLLMQI